MRPRANPSPVSMIIVFDLLGVAPLRIRQRGPRGFGMLGQRGGAAEVSAAASDVHFRLRAGCSNAGWGVLVLRAQLTGGLGVADAQAFGDDALRLSGVLPGQRRDGAISTTIMWCVWPDSSVGVKIVMLLRRVLLFL